MGYEEGGELTEKVRRNPYSVVLFDEVEKAHPEVLNILLQILEEGFVTDNSGRKINFSNCTIILTGNIGSEKISKPSVGFGPQTGESEVIHKLKNELKTFFRPEFLNRLNEIILFKNFEERDMCKITKLEINKLSGKLKDKNIKISITPKVSSFIAKTAALEKMGARPIKRLIQKYIENKLSKLILSKELKDNQDIKFSFSKNQIIYKITEAKV